MRPFTKISGKQNIILRIGIGVGVLIFLIPAYHILQSDASPEGRVKQRDIRLTPPGKTIDKKSLWMSQIEAQTQQQSQKIDLMEKLLQKQTVKPADKEREALREEVKQLREQMRHLQGQGSSQPQRWVSCHGKREVRVQRCP